MDTVSFKSRRAKQQNTSESPHRIDDPAKGFAHAEALAEIWQSTLKTSSPAPDDDFFELGGTSLHAMLMASRIDKQLACELSLVAFFENPTFAGLCASVAPSG